MMYFVHVWIDDRDWSKIEPTGPAPVHDLKVKVIDFLCKSFALKFLQCTCIKVYVQPLIDLIHV